MAYLGDWPQDIDFRTVDFKTVSITKQTTSLSGRRVRSSVSGTRFSATVRYPNMDIQRFLPIQSIATRCQGALNSFDIVFPYISENQSGVTGIVATVDGNNAAGSSTVNISTNKLSTRILLNGAVVRFPSHSKVYMLTSDATTDGSGDVTLNITPNLFEAVNDDGSSTVTVDDVPFRMTLSNELQQFKYAYINNITYEIDMLEEY